MRISQTSHLARISSIFLTDFCTSSSSSDVIGSDKETTPMVSPFFNLFGTKFIPPYLESFAKIISLVIHQALP